VLLAAAGCGPNRLETDARAYRDGSLPMDVRMAAFERVMARMTAGTPEKTVLRYLDPETRSRIADPKYGDTFSLHISAPDGTVRWKTIHNGRVWYGGGR
jgi:hypothetical protein